MKNKISSLFSALLIIAIIFTFSSCGGGGGDSEPELTPEEQRLLDLVGTTGVTYSASSITFEGSPATGFENFRLTLRGTANSKTYTTVDGDPVFSASGTWSFNDTNLNQIVIDNVTANVYNISAFNATAGTFTITVNFVAQGGVAAGTASTNGTYVFNLVKQ